jgi:subtilisin family serine protease
MAEDGHGTAVASLAAGMSPDAIGVAPDASNLSMRVTAPDGLSDGFTWHRQS